MALGKTVSRILKKSSGRKSRKASSRKASARKYKKSPAKRTLLVKVCKAEANLGDKVMKKASGRKVKVSVATKRVQGAQVKYLTAKARVGKSIKMRKASSRKASPRRRKSRKASTRK